MKARLAACFIMCFWAALVRGEQEVGTWSEWSAWGKCRTPPVCGQEVLRRRSCTGTSCVGEETADKECDCENLVSMLRNKTGDSWNVKLTAMDNLRAMHDGHKGAFYSITLILLCVIVTIISCCVVKYQDAKLEKDNVLASLEEQGSISEVNSITGHYQKQDETPKKFLEYRNRNKPTTKGKFKFGAGVSIGMKPGGERTGAFLGNFIAAPNHNNNNPDDTSKNSHLTGTRAERHILCYGENSHHNYVESDRLCKSQQVTEQDPQRRRHQSESTNVGFSSLRCSKVEDNINYVTNQTTDNNNEQHNLTYQLDTGGEQHNLTCQLDTGDEQHHYGSGGHTLLLSPNNHVP